jgi:cytidylate kinase
MSRRNNELLQERNRKIYERYKALYDIDCMRHLSVLDKLSKEFYLGTQAIGKIVVEERKVITASTDNKQKTASLI